MNKETFMNLLKYLVLVIVVYSVLKYLPNQHLCDTDLIFSTIIIVLFYILIEQLMTKKETSENFTSCPSVCNRIENMENIAPVQHKNNNELKEEVKVKEEEVKDEIVEEIQTEEKQTEEIQQEIADENKGHEKIMAFKQMLDHLKNSVDNLHQTINNTKPVDLKDIKKELETRDKKAGIERTKSRFENGVLSNELEYTDYHHLPLADVNDNESFEYGYSFLPPEKWYPQPPFPPMCVTDKKCEVMPVYTTGTPMDVKEWNESRRVTQPDNIKTKYIKEKLNSGR